METARLNGVAKTGPLEAIISRRWVRSDLADPGLDHSADVCPDNGMAKKLEVEHRKPELKGLQTPRNYEFYRPSTLQLNIPCVIAPIAMLTVLHTAT